MSRLKCLAFLVLSLVPLIAPLQAAADDVRDGSFSLLLTEWGSKGEAEFTLPAGTRFPQVTTPDRTFAADERVLAATGMVYDLQLSLGDLAWQRLHGTVRMAGYMVALPVEGEVFYLYGTFDLLAEGSSDPPIRGSIVGDQRTIYYLGTAGSGPDATVFVMRTSGAFDKLDQRLPVVGSARLISGAKLLRAVADEAGTTASTVGLPIVLTGALANAAPANFTQLWSLDGSGDLPMAGPTASQYVAAGVQRGAFTGTGPAALPGPVTMSWDSFLMTDGAHAGKGCAFGRFHWRPAGGAPLEGFIFGDLSPGAGGSTAARGYVFSIGGLDHRPSFLYGTFTGSFDDLATGGLALAVDGGVFRVGNAPPEAIRNGGRRLAADSFGTVAATSRDLNGWRSIVSTKLLVNRDPVPGGLLARYLPATNRIQVYDDAARRWGAGCALGSLVRLRAPWGTVDCATTTALRRGELIVVDWKLRPAPGSVGNWAVFGDAADAGGASSGFRAIGALSVAAPGP